MRVYLALGQTRAALRLAERDAGLKITSAPQSALHETDEATGDDAAHAAQDHDASARTESESNDAATDPASAAKPAKRAAAPSSSSMRSN